MENIFNFDILSALQEQEQTLLVARFGVNVRQIKSYLKSVYPEFEYGYAEQYDGININKILRYTNNKRYMLYGDEALYRLKMAMRAKAYIMRETGDIADFRRYLYECLYLYLRINTLTVNYSFKSFSDDVKTIYNRFYSMDEKDATDAKKMLLELTCRCKSKRVQVKYHFTLEDFKYVNGVYSSWQEAYDAWVNNYFNDLLSNYKKRTLDAYKQGIQQDKLADKYMTPELYVKLVEKKEKELDQVKIVKLSFAGFKSTVCKLFKAANMENTFILKEVAKVVAPVNKEVKEIKLEVVSEDENTRMWRMMNEMNKRYMEQMNIACSEEDDHKEDQIDHNEDGPKFKFDVPELHTNIGMNFTFSFAGIGM